MKKGVGHVRIVVLLLLFVVLVSFAAQAGIQDSLQRSLGLLGGLVEGLFGAAGPVFLAHKVAFYRLFFFIAAFGLVWSGTSRMQLFEGRVAVVMALITASFTLFIQPEHITRLGDGYVLTFLFLFGLIFLFLSIFIAAKIPAEHWWGWVFRLAVLLFGLMMTNFTMPILEAALSAV